MLNSARIRTAGLNLSVPCLTLAMVARPAKALTRLLFADRLMDLPLLLILRQRVIDYRG
jgi:hypothetical protein